PGAVGLLDAEVERITAVGRAEDGAAEVGDAPHRVGVEGDDPVLAQEPGIAAAHAQALPAPVYGGEHRSADHGVQTGGVAAPRRDGDLQRAAGGVTCFISCSTSPGWAWRPCCFLEKILRPSTSTSNTPPEDWISFTSACGYTVRAPPAPGRGSQRSSWCSPSWARSRAATASRSPATATRPMCSAWWRMPCSTGAGHSRRSWRRSCCCPATCGCAACRRAPR